MLRSKFVLLTALAVISTGCSWVTEMPGSEGVALLDAGQAGHCVKVGDAHAETAYKLGFIGRSKETVRQELLALAKNDAVNLGGNALVAEGEPVEGRQHFVIFKCP